MTKHTKYRKEDLLVKTTPFTVSRGTGGVIPYPYVNWVADHYEALCAALSYDGVDYNELPGAEPKYCLFATVVESAVPVGAPSSNAPDLREPKDISDSLIDGSENLTALLVAVFGVHVTIFLPDSAVATATITIGEAGGTVDLEIADVFTATAPDESFTFNLAAITDAGAVLWGGDGCGGERSAGGGASSFPDGFTVLTFEPSHDALIVGATYSFDAAGANRRLPCMMRIGGANAFPLPIFDGGGIETVKFPGRVHCQAGETVTVDVAEENTGGGAVRIALLYAEV
jgi:hypothetical protein